MRDMLVMCVMTPKVKRRLASLFCINKKSKEKEEKEKQEIEKKEEKKWIL